MRLLSSDTVKVFPCLSSESYGKTAKGSEKRMQLQKTVIALLALLVAAMAIVPCVTAEENDQSRLADEAKVQNLIKSINTDIRQIVDERHLYSEKAGTDGFSFPVSEFIRIHDKDLDEIILTLADLKDIDLDETQKATLKEIIVAESFKHISADVELEKRGLKIEDAKVFTPIILGVANSTEDFSKLEKASLLSVPSLKLRQVYYDISGGSSIDDDGWDFDIDGNNDLTSVMTWGTSYPYTYRLIYKDEDHPNPSLDALYDYYRCGDWDEEGCEDSAQFTVWDANNVQYSLSWSDTYTFGYPTGNHGSITRTNYPRMYVSNIWNHDIGTEDTNPSLSKIVMSVPYYPQ
jgi:hypothetical protein